VSLVQGEKVCRYLGVFGTRADEMARLPASEADRKFEV